MEGWKGTPNSTDTAPQAGDPRPSSILHCAADWCRMEQARWQSWQEHSGSVVAAVLQRWPFPPSGGTMPALPPPSGDSPNGSGLSQGGCDSTLSSLCEHPTPSGLWLAICEPCNSSNDGLPPRAGVWRPWNVILGMHEARISSARFTPSREATWEAVGMQPLFLTRRLKRSWGRIPSRAK